MKHVMIDIETMGTSPYSAITSIAAVRFGLETGEIGEKVYIPVSLQSCLDAGLIVNASTIMWWMQQSDQARRALFSGDQAPIDMALHSLNAFISKEDYVWGNSARFDLGLLENAYERTGYKLPWKYFNERDVRTLVAFAPHIKKEYPREGVAHNALDDCEYQIGYCCEIWKSIKLNILQ